ncbi:MAG: tRNA epoxyqueuosine(34) reductase QueG [Pseudomonadota bacterium]
MTSPPPPATTAALTALRRDIDDWAQAAGFDALRVTDVDLSAYANEVRDWLARGFAGDMAYLHANLDKRLDPAALVPDTIRVLCARMSYRPGQDDALGQLQRDDGAYIARYALGRDYHKVLRRRLARLGARIADAARDFGPSYRAFTDSAPVLEKPLGEKAGLGWIGKHGLLLSEDVGSWFFLGEIYTSLPLPIDPPVHGPRSFGECGNCRACMTVCPTDAIVAPGQLDARRCIAYLTIEHKGVIPEPLRAPMGNRVFGCDDCQLYCPWNREAPATTEPDFDVRHSLDTAQLLPLFELSEADFLAVTEGMAIRRISYEQWQRNLAVGLGNGPPAEAVFTALRNRRQQASALVREHIDWALAQLTARAGSA